MGLKKIKVEDFSFSFEHQLFHQVNCEIFEQQITILLGRNGAGKTTFFDCLAGELKGQGGKISYQTSSDEVVSQLSNSDYGYMSDDFFYYERLTVEQMCSLIARLREQEKSDFQEKYTRYMKQLKLSDYEKVAVKDLSLGTKQRVHLLITILHEPSLILLDEPTNGLDPEQVHGFKLLVNALKEEGRIILISTHSLKLVEDIADRVLLLSDKKIREMNKTDNLEQTFLENIGSS